MSDTVLSAAIAAVVALAVGAVTGVVTFFVAERKLASDNIIQERKIWRETVRKLAIEVQAALADPCPVNNVIGALRLKFAINLNPHDRADSEILELIEEGEPAIRASRIRGFEQRVTLLLKHDWERAKWETGLFRVWLKREPQRVLFADFTAGKSHSYRVWRGAGFWARLGRLKVEIFGKWPVSDARR